MEAERGSITIRRVDSHRASEWLREAWALFREAPGTWIGIVLIWLVASTVIGMMPLLGLVSNLFTPVVMGGLMLACERQRAGNGLSLDALIEGFRSPALSKLIVLGVFALVGTVIIGALILGSLFMTMGGAMMMGDHAPAVLSTLSLTGIAGVLVAAALVLPLTMALWFAPALIVFRNLEAADAIKASFDGCLRNIWPLTVYSLLALVLLAVACVPLFLGLLVAVPLLLISVYTSYLEIFGQDRDEAQPLPPA